MNIFTTFKSGLINISYWFWCNSNKKLAYVLIPLFFTALPFNQLNAQTTFTFTNAGATGPTGPTQTQITTEYTNTSLDGRVTVNNGIQYWVVPSTGSYLIEATGASGGGANGGFGANMSGTFLLTAGDTIMILVGQEGLTQSGEVNSVGGGGGTFVVKSPGKNTSDILIIAGGGGGSPSNNYSDRHASTSTSGNDGHVDAGVANPDGAGGTNGNGGNKSVSGCSLDRGAGGGGFLTDGGSICQTAGNADGGDAFINGGAGGTAANAGTHGGFGGGGAVWQTGFRGSGGGGGYSGGGGGQINSNSADHHGGGGGSYNGGGNQNNILASSAGDGLVIISPLSSGATNDAGVVSIDSPNVYCPGTHNVVATVQNFGINILDSVEVHWSVNGTAQTSVTYVGTIDTFGGSGSPTAQVTLGSYTFTASSYDVKVWSSSPNGVADTMNDNDTAKTTMQSNLPPPTGLTATTINATNATIEWAGGSASNSWLYTVVTSGSPISGIGTATSADTAYLSNLNPTTTYDFYVREVCPTGDTSNWAGPLTFRTPCSVILSGNYTIDPSQSVSSTNFVSISDAIDALKECGINDAVTFNIASGTYTGQVVLNEISGASSSNTITFKGAGKSTTTITHNGTSTANWQTIFLDGADWITFRDITIEGTGSFAIGIHLTNNADNNTFKNIDVEVSTTSTSTNVEGIVGSGSATAYSTTGNPGENNTFDSINVSGGYYGVYYTGNGTTSTIGSSIFNNIHVEDHYYYGINVQYLDEPQITNCRIEQGRYAYSYGLRVYYCRGPVVMNNIAHGGGYGMYFYYNNANNYNNVRGQVINNIITANNYYGVYAPGSDYIDYYHNTFYTTGYEAIYFSAADNIDLINNILISFSSADPAIYATGSTFNEIDFNIYWAPNYSFVAYHNANYSTLTDWQAAEPTFNEFSYEEMPDFVDVNNNDFHLQTSIPSRRGADVGVNIDVDLDSRCTFAPTIGADESGYPEPSPVANFSAGDTIYVNSPYTFNNAANASDAAAHQWYLNGVFQTAALHFRYVPSSTGTDTLKLVTQSCGGMDSITKTVVVDIPPRKPEAAFIADKNIVDVFEEVQLMDLSTFGPVGWEWQISPATYSSQFGPLPTYSFLNNTDEFSQNPVIVFDNPGTYSITLIATNSQGSDTTVRRNYIIVRATSNMCIFPFETNVPSGTLYDEGGPTGNYSAGRNGLNICYYKIDPCAATVTLELNQFDLNTGDYLRVYDGENNSGTPLWDASAYPNGMTGGITNASVVTSLTAQSGTMYIEFESDNSTATVGPGFEAEWSSTQGNFAAPVADFAMPDTVCVGIPANFENLSSGVAVTFTWDAENDDIIDGNQENLTYTFPFTGTYEVLLIAENCGGVDSIIKTVTVISPTHAPNTDFTADITRPNIGEVVNFFDLTTYCVENWRWEITPTDFTYTNGTNAQSQHPQVIFDEPGYYNVKLVTSNASGADSIVKQQYILAIQFCTPAIVNLNSDLGISRFVLGDIDNSSDIGDAGYTDYAEDLSTELEKGATYTVMLERNTTNNPMNRKVWIDFNQDGDFDDPGELVAMQSSSFAAGWSDTFTVPVSAIDGATRMRVGTSFGNLSNTPCGPNTYGEYEDYRVIIRPDETAPEITLIGSDTVTIEQCRSYTDAGATATDNVDGNLTSQITVAGLPVDSCTTGMHTITYSATDAQGNIGTAVRIVNVIADTTDPVLILAGNNPDTTLVHTSWTEPGYTATDNVGGTITSSVTVSGSVDTATVGTYTLTYSVTDAEGNTANAARTVLVVDAVAPVIALNGADTIYVEVGGTFTDPGATATDNYDTSLTVNVSGMVDVNTVGTYTLTYCTEDASGNPACIDRTVIVQDTEAPVVTLIGANPIIVEVYSNFTDPGINVTDNYYTNFTVTTSGSWDGTADSLGDFTIVYEVTDGSGNTATATRTVRVVDTEAPSIILNGPSMVYLQRWEDWNDPWVTVSDNYDINPTVDTNTNFNGALLEGFYYITYWAVDQSGNKSNEVTRYIIVSASTSGIGSGNEVSVSVYPNPNNGRFVAELELAKTENVHMAVTDMMGREISLIHNGNSNGGKFEVDLAGAKQGVYFIKVMAGEQLFIKKFVVAK